MPPKDTEELDHHPPGCNEVWQHPPAWVNYLDDGLPPTTSLAKRRHTSKTWIHVFHVLCNTTKSALVTLDN